MNKTRNKFILLTGLILAAVTIFSLKEFLIHGTSDDNTSQKQSSDKKRPQRIISLAPSITEFLFALDCGDKTAGVTRYCSYPPQAADLPAVGGFLDPNYEAVLSVSPDLVILLEASRDAEKHLSGLGFRTFVVDHSCIDGIVESAKTIGEAAGVPEKGKELADFLQSRLEKIKQKTQNLPRPKVLLTIERPLGTGSPASIRNVCIAGQDGFYSTMIKAAGGKNAFPNKIPAFPVVSAEGILRMNPDIIIELRTNPETSGTDDHIRDNWSGLSRIKAVNNNAIYILRKDFLTIPGPRFIQTIETLTEILHPELSSIK